MSREPIKVKRGSISVTIRPVDNNGYPAFSVEYYDTTRKLKRIKRAKLEDAKLEAEQVIERISQGDKFRTLTREEVISYLTAIEGLPHGKMLHEVVQEWKKLSEAKSTNVVETKTFDSAWREMVEQKRADGFSPYYIQDLVTRLGAFGKFYKGNVSGLSGELIDGWLRGLDVKPTTRNNFRSILSTFVTFAKKKKWLPKEWDGLDQVATAKEKDVQPVQIFHAEPVRKLIEGASEKMIPFLALGFFAGIRHAEISRMDWTAINFKTKWITVDQNAVKSHRSATRRLVPLLPVLDDILRPIKQDKGPFIVPWMYNLYQLCKAVDVEWKHNVARHSFISHRLAIVKSSDQVALECGNSSTMIFKHYRELVSEEQAKEYFEIFP